LVQNGQLRKRFDGFVEEWQQVCKVFLEFKAPLADIQRF